jgi:processive 1,2-diacylglycerol beta-glucosyltransferase
MILAMAGTEGSPEALAHLEAVARTPLDADMLIVCGRNRRLLKRVQRLHGVNPIVPLGFVKDVADLMVASDVLLTKTGGVSLAEAFCCGLPVLAFDPLPGQEEGNARFVVASGAAELAESPAQLAALVGELRWSAGRRETLATNGYILAAPGAAAAAARAIVERIRTTRQVHQLP